MREVLRYQEVAEADPTKKLGADTVQNCIDNFCAVLRWVDVHPKRSLAEGGIDHLDDCVSDRRDIRIGRHD